MYWGLENGLTIILLVIGLLIVSIAQIRIKTTYNKYSQIKNKNSLTGQEVARKILEANKLNNIYVVETKGELTDHYDPTRKVVKLSTNVYDNASIAAISIAAHEVGHALQDKEKYLFMIIRSKLVPVVNFITYIGYFVAFISLLGGITGYLKISIIIILAALLFQVITLPVEFDASKRAQDELLKLKLINDDEKSGINNVLSAAAMTYVASFVSSLINLLRLFIMLRGKDD